MDHSFESQINGNPSTLVEKWNEIETLALIRIYKMYKNYFTRAKRKKFVWENISRRLGREGINKSRIHVESKWKSLLRTYRKYQSSAMYNPITGVRFKYMDEMFDIFGNEQHLDKEQVSTSEARLYRDSDSSSEDVQQNNDIVYGFNKEDLISEDNEQYVHEAKKRKTSHTNPYDNLVRLRKVYLKCKMEDMASKRNHREEYLGMLLEEQELKKLREDKLMQLKERQLDLEKRKTKLLENYLPVQSNVLNTDM